ncbi:MAG: ATPase domain-containing protein [Chloroflexota bacterium]|jgi:KaiC/GvpD/RAD55 family RecA-like ATPase|nr:ATPase domain-containing protein [Chloroflexota bacterium]
MDTITLQADWLDRLMPEGLPIPSSTLLTGPGGSGKPLVGNFIAATWLRQGGSVVFMSLQYPDHSFIISSLKRITQLNLEDYGDRTAFIELDVHQDGMEKQKGRSFKANVVKPSIWDEALHHACEMVPNEGPGILVFGSALNLLLFSPTYGQEILEEMKNTLQGTSSCSYLFSTSSTAKGKEIAELEAVADNLISVRGDRATKKILLKIERMKAVQFISDEIEAPFSPKVLKELKDIADQSRKRIIPLVSKI